MIAIDSEKSPLVILKDDYQLSLINADTKKAIKLVDSVTALDIIRAFSIEMVKRENEIDLITIEYKRP
jgi:hypothetical protein